MILLLRSNSSHLEWQFSDAFLRKQNKFAQGLDLAWDISDQVTGGGDSPNATFLKAGAPARSEVRVAVWPCHRRLERPGRRSGSKAFREVCRSSSMSCQLFITQRAYGLSAAASQLSIAASLRGLLPTLWGRCSFDLRARTERPSKYAPLSIARV